MPSFVNEMVKIALAKKEMYVYTAIPRGAPIEKEGILSGFQVARSPRLARIARPDKKEREAWLSRVRRAEAGKDQWEKIPFKGPSVFFAPPPEGIELHENHPMRRWGLKVVKINLSRLLQDHPKTRMHGLELHPYHAGKAGRSKRLTRRETQELVNRAPEDLWKHFENTGHHYAADVPHAALITPTGRIDPQYIERLP